MFNKKIPRRYTYFFYKYDSSYTFERVQNDSEKLWRFERYTVINDYDWRIPSPINLLLMPYRFCRYLAIHDCCSPHCKRRGFKLFLSVIQFNVVLKTGNIIINIFAEPFFDNTQVDSSFILRRLNWLICNSILYIIVIVYIIYILYILYILY